MLNEKQRTFITDVLDIHCDFDHLTDDDVVRIEDTASDHLCLKCFDENYQPNDEGKMCEDILFAIADI